MIIPTKERKTGPKIQKAVYTLNFNGFYSKFHDPYTYLDIAFCVAPTKGKIVKQVTPHTSCRETLAGYLFSQFTSNNNRYYMKSKCDIPTNKTVLVIRKHIPELVNEWSHETKNNNKCKEVVEKARGPFEQRILKGLKILNTLERKHGWPITKVYMLENKSPKHDGKEQGITCLTYMLIGSNKWIMASPMLSMFILIIRSGYTITENFNSYSSMMKAIKESIEKARSGDKYHIKVTYKYWDLLMANYSKLFRNLKISTNYNKSEIVRRLDEAFCHDGITALCKGKCVNKVLFERFNTIKKEAGEK